MHWRSLVYLSVVLLLVALRFWFSSDAALWALADAGIDDALFVYLAEQIGNGQWLGAYSDLTLAKGPFYPLWIALNHSLGLPLLDSQQALFITACVVFVGAIQPMLPNRWIGLLLLVVLLFNPVNYSQSITTRVLREGIYPALTLLALAGALRLVLVSGKSDRLPLGWALLAGLAFAALWLTREEGIWLVPSLLLAVGYAAWRNWREGMLNIRNLLLLCLPAVLPILAVLTVSSLNHLHYGVFRTNDIVSGPFADAYSSLIRIRSHERNVRIPLPRQTRSRLYELSPAFARLKLGLEGNPPWGPEKSHSGQADYGGGHLFWAMRRRAWELPGMRNATDLDRYWETLASEIDSICAAGQLPCDPPGSGMMPRWRNSYLRPLLTTIRNTTVSMARFDTLWYSIPRSEGSEDNLRMFRRMVEEPFAPMLRDIQTGRLNFSACIESALRPLQAQVVDLGGNVVAGPYAGSSQAPTPGSTKQGPSGNCDLHFVVDSDCPASCLLEITSAGNTLGRIELDSRARGTDYGNFKAGLYASIPAAMSEGVGAKESLRDYYQRLAPWIAAASLGLFLIGSLWGLWRRRLSAGWIVLAILLGTVTSRILIVSLIQVTSFDAANPTYLSPAYGPGLAFLVLTPFVLLGGRRRSDRQPVSP